MTKIGNTTRTKTNQGWIGLVNKRFNGNEAQAKAWVADLGRASFFVDTRPLHAGAILAKWQDKFPHLIVNTDKGPYPKIHGQVWRY